MKLKVCFPLPRDELLKDVHRIQSHPEYDGDLFHQHVQAIDASIIDQIRWLVPYDMITIATSISFLPLPRPNGGMDSDWVFPEFDMLMTISELRPNHVDTRCPCTELIFHLNMSGSPAFDLLLEEFMAEPTRGNQQYQLDGEKCPRLARNLWIYLLP